MIVTHFDPKLPVIVRTDASGLFGLGYAMGHMIDGRFGLVTCVVQSHSHLLNKDIPPLS